MKIRTLSIVVLCFVFGLTCVGTVSAQQGSPEDLRRRTNIGTVGIISGGVNGTYIRIAADLAKVLDRPDELRVLPIMGKGSVQNINDVLYLRGIDIGIVQSDVLEFIKRERIHPTIGQRIRYVTKLYNEEFHLLGGKGVSSVEDLAGKQVNLGVPGSGTFMTAQTIFETLGISVEPTSFDQALAYEKLKSGEIAGMVYVAGKPARLFESLEPEEGISFITVPATPELLEIYLPARLEHDDYPRLIAEDAPVDTVAVGAVMAVYNWNRNGDRYRKVARFVEAFFDSFDEFLDPSRHPKWQEVNLGAVVPGWTRFSAAQEWLDAQPPPLTAEQQVVHDQFEEFMQFVEETGRTEDFGNMSPKLRKAVFMEFLAWKESRSN